MASAGPGKKGKKKKGTPVDLNVFLQNEKGASDGKAVVITKTATSWADQMDDFDSNVEKTVVLPTAPSSVRGGIGVDLDRIPVNGPYKVFVANVSYDADEDMIAAMFKGLDVVSVHLPSDGSGRFKGFGYVEFGNRDDLIEALQMDDLEVGGRKLRIDLKTPSERDQQRGYSSFRTDGDPDRAESDWRSGPRTEPARQDRDWRSGPRSDSRGFGDYGDRGGFGSRDREQASTMANKPGSKYEAVPSFSDYGRGGDRGGGGYGYDRRGDDRYGGRDDRFDRDRGGGGYGYDRRGDDRYGGRDDRYDRDGGGGGGYGYNRRGDGWYGSREGRYDRDRGGGGYGYDRRGDDRYGGRDDRYDRGRGDDRDDPRDGPRFGSRDGPRYDSRDGPRDGPRYDSRDGPRDGPRFDSRDGPRYDSRDGPRYDSRDGPRYDSRDGARDGPRDGPWDAPRYGSREGPGGTEGSTGDGDRPPAARPKLNLKPRSAPAEEIGKPAAASSSIFGGARPVDTTARERAVEERLKSRETAERPRPAADGPPSGSQRRAEASRDIRYADGPPPKPRTEEGRSVGSTEETNGKSTEGGERRERQPRPPKVLDEKPAVFAEPSRFSALAEDDD